MRASSSAPPGVGLAEPAAHGLSRSEAGAACVLVRVIVCREEGGRLLLWCPLPSVPSQRRRRAWGTVMGQARTQQRGGTAWLVGPVRRPDGPSAHAAPVAGSLCLRCGEPLRRGRSFAASAPDDLGPRPICNTRQQHDRGTTQRRRGGGVCRASGASSDRSPPRQRQRAEAEQRQRQPKQPPRAPTAASSTVLLRSFPLPHPSQPLQPLHPARDGDDRLQRRGSHSIVFRGIHAARDGFGAQHHNGAAVTATDSGFVSAAKCCLKRWARAAAAQSNARVR